MELGHGRTLEHVAVRLHERTGRGRDMPDEFTPEEQDILANSPADAPVLIGDDEETGDEEPGAGD